MIHIVFVDDPNVEPIDRMLCEIQFSLKKLTMTRKEMGGHDAYSSFRSALEIQRFVEHNLK